jgi:hypothetical protein
LAFLALATGAFANWQPRLIITRRSWIDMNLWKGG